MAELSAEEVFGRTTFLEKILEELEDVFPPQNPTPLNDIETIMFRAGQRTVIDYLNQKLGD